MSIALYTLADQYAVLMQQLDAGDHDAQTIADTIEASGLTEALQDKAQGVEMVARTAEQYLPAIDAEIARLVALKKAREAVAQGLRDYIKRNMEAAGIEKIECPLFKISIAKNPDAVEILNAVEIPTEYLAEQKPAPPRAPDKKKIGAALKAGTELTWARLTQSTRLKVA